ncbi:hypothetical protein Rleg4DRAFT_2294 [Rhizobium leguminosarum bv. trifolii WSM2297]|uniref:Uncharacterized protein n=2 Tax=Rhizobium leguminosarum TaxID=384 RepID=J0KSU3_RHILT|nr:hypothetical protein Rleg4DRAFT_2294 [Rhizobium leguminosarum bv. trifolii WSM2297]
MSDEDAIRCILKAVEIYRRIDRSRFEKGHPDYERTTLEGWAVGALSLRRVIRRLGISGQEAVERAITYGIELPYFADRELEALNSTSSSTVIGFDKSTRTWAELPDEDE